jgi:hypothetical protein
MMEKLIISNIKNKLVFWKKIIIRFVNVETDPSLWYVCLGSSIMEFQRVFHILLEK